MRKLDNSGKPFLFDGEEVIRDFDNQVADNLMKLNGVKWEVIEDSRKVKSKPRPVATEEAPKEEPAKEEPKAKKKSSKKK